MKRVKKHVHFMGVGGSGMSAAAALAYNQGFIVSGCDLQKDTPYLSQIKKRKIPIYSGHNSGHLKGVDILAVTPAALFQNKDNPEIVAAKKI